MATPGAPDGEWMFKGAAFGRRLPLPDSQRLLKADQFRSLLPGKFRMARSTPLITEGEKSKIVQRMLNDDERLKLFERRLAARAAAESAGVGSKTGGSKKRPRPDFSRSAPGRPFSAEDVAPRDLLREVGMSQDEFNRIDLMYRKVDAETLGMDDDIQDALGEQDDDGCITAGEVQQALEDVGIDVSAAPSLFSPLPCPPCDPRAPW